MQKTEIKLNNIGDLQRFVGEITSLSADIDAVHGRYVIDAKSILGLMSLDLSKPIELRLYSDESEIVEKFNNIIAEYK